MDSTDTNDSGSTGGSVSPLSARRPRSTFRELRPGGEKSAAALRSELSSLKNDLDSLVDRSAGLSDEELAQAHARLMAKFSSVRYAARGIASEASRQFSRGVETTTGYVKEKPMQSVAVAVGTGLLLGMLFRRR